MIFCIWLSGLTDQHILSVLVDTFLRTYTSGTFLISQIAKRIVALFGVMVQYRSSKHLKISPTPRMHAHTFEIANSRCFDSS
jgi:hypothetical protein